MQSSAVVTLRVAVMLTCLIVAPMAAIFGSSLPKVVSSVLQGKGIPASSRPVHKTDQRKEGGEAPVFGASITPSAIPNTAGAANGVEAASLWPPGATPAAMQTQQLAPQQANTQPGQQPVSRAVAATDPAPMQIPGTGAGAHPAPAAAPAGETSQTLERRLRELGATYYLLEYLGTNSQHYRFYCKMSIAGNPNLTRPFEATDSDPVQAMRHVLDQVQKWRAGSQP